MFVGKGDDSVCVLGWQISVQGRNRYVRDRADQMEWEFADEEERKEMRFGKLPRDSGEFYRAHRRKSMVSYDFLGSDYEHRGVISTQRIHIALVTADPWNSIL